ncbi:MAG: hypothetical protein QW820_07060 [Sulfolobales archaeon]
MIWAYFTFLGFLGALAYVLFWSKSLEELKSFESIRHLAVGAIVGYLYSILHSEHGFPDSVMAFVAGWMGVDFISSLVERLKGRLSKSKT